MGLLNVIEKLYFRLILVLFDAMSTERTQSSVFYFTIFLGWYDFFFFFIIIH